MKNVETLGCEVLSTAKMQQIRGGTEAPQSSFWNTFTQFLGNAAEGLIEFGKVGGRNAGLTVK